MEFNEVAAMLKSTPMFSGCTQKELHRIAGAVRQTSHLAGTKILTEGRSGAGFFIIVDGVAKVTVRGKQRSELTGGDSFGEMALVDRGPRTATVTAETPIDLLQLSPWDFQSILKEIPALSLHLLKTMAQRLRAAEKELLV